MTSYGCDGAGALGDRVGERLGQAVAGWKANRTLRFDMANLQLVGPESVCGSGPGSRRGRRPAVLRPRSTARKPAVFPDHEDRRRTTLHV